jgi:hypothetical protein
MRDFVVLNSITDKSFQIINIMLFNNILIANWFLLISDEF